MQSSCCFWWFPSATNHQKQGTMLTSHGSQTFPVHILQYILNKEKDLRGGLQNVVHITIQCQPGPYIVFECCNPQFLQCSLEGVTGALPSLVNATNHVCYGLPTVSAHRTLSAHHHLLESSWKTACHVAHEWTAFCLYQTLWIFPFLLLCVF